MKKRMITLLFILAGATQPIYAMKEAQQKLNNKLRSAIHGPDKGFLQFWATDRKQEVENAVKAGADVNAQYEGISIPGLEKTEPETPLSLAASRGLTDIVEYLLEQGAKPNALNGAALLKACWRGHDKVMTLLVKHGAKTTDECAEMLNKQHKNSLLEQLRKIEKK